MPAGLAWNRAKRRIEINFRPLNFKIALESILRYECAFELTTNQLNLSLLYRCRDKFSASKF